MQISGARSIKGKGRMHTFYLFPDEQHRQASECQAASVESSSLLSPPKSSGALAERSSPAVLAKYLSASPEKSCPVALVKCRASMESSGPSVMAKRATSCSEGLVLEGRSGQLMLAGKGDPSSHGCWYGYEGCLEWKDCAAAAEAQSLEAVAVGYNMFTTNINKEGRVKLSWIHFFAPEEVGLSSLWVLLQLPAASTLYLSFHSDGEEHVKIHSPLEGPRGPLTLLTRLRVCAFEGRICSEWPTAQNSGDRLLDERGRGPAMHFPAEEEVYLERPPSALATTA
eukprot:1156475-Pelagomonas_calceolata.AAC.11